MNNTNSSLQDKNKLPVQGGFLRTLETGAAAAALVLLTLLPLMDAALRSFFHSRFPAAPETAAHILLVLGLVSGMVTTREETHLSIGFFQYLGDERIKRSLGICTRSLAAFLAMIFFWCSLSFIKVGLYPVQMIGPIPDRVFAMIMPLGYAVMALRFAGQGFRFAGGSGWKAVLPPALALILGTVCSTPAILKLIWGINMPDAAWAASGVFNSLAAVFRLPGIIILVAAALGGAPIFTVIGGFALILLQSSWGEIDITASQIYTALTQNNLAAIPLFTLAGFILSESKAGERLVLAFKGLFGWLPGGMIVVTVILCAFFTSFTGASGVTILAMGGILLTVLSGYPEKFAIGLLTASGSIGLLFPPSLPILLVGAYTRTNTVHLFLGALIPGILLVAATILFGLAVSVKNKIPVEPFSLKKAAGGLRGSFLEILLPFVLIAGYFSGVLSLVELSAVAAAYVAIVEIVIYREVSLPALSRVFSKSIPIIGGILSILALAQALSYYIVDSRVPEFFAQWMQHTVSSKWLFLLLLNLALLVTGCLVDIFSAIMIILPLIFPLGAVYGIDPVHLGVIFLINMEAGFLTPPVGLNLFLASYRFEKPFTVTSRYVLPFLVIQLVVVLIVTYAPVLTTALTALY
ncbi:MAG: TRAP transporter large permease subunit [Spirochaetaceae bacterium]|jgi:tripartite ATP-independent transporter DctM subunit|nr:TRAP transporter large permease subunit [Spirochaetaceae bacterium]